MVVGKMIKCGYNTIFIEYCKTVSVLILLFYFFSGATCMHFVIFFFRNYLLELCVATTKINVTDFITICYKTEI